MCNNVRPIHDRFNQVFEEEDEEYDEYMYENYDFHSNEGLKKYYNDKWGNMFS